MSTDRNAASCLANGIQPKDESKSHQLQLFQSLVIHYEALVADMTTELSNCQQDFQNFRDGRYRGDDSLYEEFLQNLTSQMQTMQKVNATLKALYQSALDHIDQLESKMSDTHQKSSNVKSLYAYNCADPDDVLVKLKLVQNRASALEARLAQEIREKMACKNTLMDAYVDHHAEKKRISEERIREIEKVKASYKEQLESIQLELEECRNQHKTVENVQEEEQSGGRKLENDRVTQVQLLLDTVVTERNALLAKQEHLSSDLKNVAVELLAAKSLLARNHQQLELQVQREKEVGNMKNPYLNSFIEIEGASKTDEHNSTQIQLEKIKRMTLKEEQLEAELCKMRGCLGKLQGKESERILRLETRMRELEHLNSTLQSQLFEEREKYRALEQEKDRRFYDNVDLLTNKLNQTNLDSRRRDLREQALTHQLQVLIDDRRKLLTMVETQRRLAAKWEAEYKRLFHNVSISNYDHGSASLTDQ